MKRNLNTIFRTVAYIVYKDDGTKEVTHRDGRKTTRKFRVSYGPKKK